MPNHRNHALMAYPNVNLIDYSDQQNLTSDLCLFCQKVFVRLMDNADVSEARTQQLLEQYGTNNLKLSGIIRNSSWAYQLPSSNMVNIQRGA